MESTVDQIKSKLDIVEFLSSYITLKKTGRNFKALCPFHQEKTASFVVSPDRQIWHCFGACQDGGDVIRFLMKWENITFYEALKELANKTGVKLVNVDFEDKTWKRKEKLIEINNLTSDFFSYVLEKSKFGKKALDYLTGRKINLKTIKKFQLGYAPVSWDSLYKFLSKKKYLPGEVFDSGLLVKSERGSYYDRFRGRIMFPIKDLRGNIVGFSGRLLDNKEKEAKYINTPETLIYHKRETLYGIDLAKEAIKKEKNAFLVEGEFDMISPYQQGIENMVAIKGSAVTKEQLMLLKRYTNRITLTLDADMAGQEAAKRGIETAEELDFETEVVSLDFAKDPDEAIQIDPVKFKQIIKKPIPIYDFVINLSQKKYPGDDPFNKKKIGEEVCLYLEKIRNPIVRSHYVKKLAALLDVSESSIESLIKRTKFRNNQKQLTASFRTKGATADQRQLLIQKYLLSLIFQNEKPYKIAGKIFSTLETNDFNQPSYVKILEIFFNNKEKTFVIKDFVNNLSSEIRSVFDELYLYADVETSLSQENIDKLIYEVKKDSLKRKISELLNNKKNENNDFDQEVKELNQRLKEVEKKLSAV